MAQQRYREQAAKFAQSLINETYQSSYNLCSRHLKAHADFEGFTRVHREARARYGKPERFGLTIDAATAEAITADPLGIPAGLPLELCRAWVTITLETNPGPDGKQTPLYVCRVLLVEDLGKERVGFYQYAPYSP